MTLPKVRIVSTGGWGRRTRVWLDGTEITASLSRLVVDVDDLVRVELTIPAAQVDYEGEALVDVRPPAESDRITL